MDEIGIDRRQRGIVLAGVHQHLAHADERGGAARRIVHAADELLAARLARPLQARQRLRLGGCAIGVDGALRRAWRRRRNGWRAPAGRQAAPSPSAASNSASRRSASAMPDASPRRDSNCSPRSMRPAPPRAPSAPNSSPPEQRPAAGRDRIQQFGKERRAPRRPRLSLRLHRGIRLRSRPPRRAQGRVLYMMRAAARGNRRAARRCPLDWRARSGQRGARQFPPSRLLQTMTPDKDDRLVARRRHLPDLSALLSGYERRRRRRSRRHHAPARPMSPSSASTRSGSRRSSSRR